MATMTMPPALPVKNDTCFRCGEHGHIGRDCPKTANVCYRCNQEGHIAKDCPLVDPLEARFREDITCFKCQNKGHLAKNCPYTEDADGKPLPKLECFTCHKDGHLSKNCPESGGNTCFKCNGRGHVARDCPVDRTPSRGGGGEVPRANVRELVFEAVYATLRDRGFSQDQRENIARESSDAAADFIEGRPRGRTTISGRSMSGPGSTPSNSSCFKCGKSGHFSRDCPLAGDDKCYRCLKEGHRSKDCPNPRARSRSPRNGRIESRGADIPGRGPLMCYRCGGEGHLGRDCHHAKDVCFKCRKEGHRSHECPEGKR